jgi:magnesium chelatase family protein
MHVDVPAVSPADLALPPPREGSREVAARVAFARELQRQRYEGKGIRSNAEADGQLLDEVATPDVEGRKLLASAAERFKLSARGYHRVMRVARTLADLDSSAGVRRVNGGGPQLSPHRAGAELGVMPKFGGERQCVRENRKTHAICGPFVALA